MRRDLLPLAALRLEPRQRPLPARRRHASCVARGHEVASTSRATAGAVSNLRRASTAQAPLDGFARAYPRAAQRDATTARRSTSTRRCDGADLVHRARVERPGAGRARIGERRAARRALSRCCSTTRTTARSPTPEAMAALRPRALRRRARLRRGARATSTCARGWARRAWTWHEAADTRVFRPLAEPRAPRGDLVWIGNWGDDERTAELQRVPARAGAARSACGARPRRALSRETRWRRWPAPGIELRRLAAELPRARRSSRATA